MTRFAALVAVLVPLLAVAGTPSESSKEPAPRITLKTHGSLREVAERIASEGKLSVVVRGELDEDAEVFFQNVPADDALETLARAYGLSLEKRGNIFTLRPHAEGSPPPKMVMPVPPIPPVPPVPPMAPMPPMPKMGHPGHHPSHDQDEADEADEDQDQDNDEDEAENSTPPSDYADKFKQFDKFKDFKDLKDLKDLKDMLKFHRRAEGSDRQTVGTGNVTVEEDQEVDDAVAYGGSLFIKGRVRNDAVAFGGNVQLGPHAMVGGDAVAFGGNVERESGAKVHGQVLSFGGKGGGLSAIGPSEKKSRSSDRHSGSSIFWLLIQFAIYFALGFVFIMFAPRPMKQLESEIRRDPLRCALTGLLGALAIAGLAVLLTITVIGIPFTLVLVVVTAVGIAMGYSAVASEVGTRLPVLRANRKTQAAVLALGILVLLVLQLIPVLGKLILAAATCVALGATIRTRFGTRPREFPEPV
ncbi:MAG TPA: STN domain-containing protein [Myxococcaceae bacterium]|nr:STN domain-containing protein [Myxococcaceae bacterium]